MKNEQLIERFRQHLMLQGKSGHTVTNAARAARRFLNHVGDQRLDRVSEEQACVFFAAFKGKTRQIYAMHVAEFLKFALARLPVPVKARGAESPRAAAPAKKDIALREKWNADKLRDQKEADDKLIAQLGRKLIDHYLFFQRLLKDGEVDLDTVSRLPTNAAS